MPVASTSTATDKLAEARRLNGDIAILKQEKETLQRDVSRLAEAKTSLLEEHGKHYDVSELKDAVLENIRTRLRSENATLESNKEKLVKNISDLRQEESDIAGRVTRAREDLAPAEEAVQKIRDTAVIEAGALNRFREDAAKEMQIQDATTQKLRNEAAAARLELEFYETEYQRKRAEISEGEKRVGIREEDVAILEDRYKRKIEAVSPESLGAALNELQHVKGLTSTENATLARIREEISAEVATNGAKATELRQEVTDLSEKLVKFREEYATKNADLLGREEALANRSADLKTYEAKLREKCLELYPELEIIL